MESELLRKSIGERWVGGSIPLAGFVKLNEHYLGFGNWDLGFDNMGRYPSGQRGQTVNLLHLCFRGSNPLLPIKTRYTLTGCDARIVNRYTSSGRNRKT